MRAIIEWSEHTVLADVATCAEWTETDGGISVPSNAASSIATTYPATYVRTAVHCNTSHANARHSAWPSLRGQLQWVPVKDLLRSYCSRPANKTMMIMIRHCGSISLLLLAANLSILTYNKCIAKFFGYTRRDSMTGILLELPLPALDTVKYNTPVVLANQCLMPCNNSVQ